MYEKFGFSRAAAGDIIQLFVPDNTIDPTQYTRGGPCRIAEIRLIGDFQSQIAPASVNWDPASGLVMTRRTNANGYLYEYIFPVPLKDGYYQYQYLVKFSDHTVRRIGDPCTKYGGDSDDRSAFVVGGSPIDTIALANPLPTGDLRLYELMVDDFTVNYRGAAAPLDAVVGKLDYLSSLNINGIEFMPWIAIPDDTPFSWGYDPAFFFSVESRYVNDPGNPLDRLSRLANLINECHKRNLHVVLDIVLQHARQGSNTNGFPYYWLWQNASECPFVGVPSDSSFNMLPLIYDNLCTQQFVTDVCKYWIDTFKIDGFRFDQVTGYDDPRFPTEGAPGLIADLSKYVLTKGLNHFALVLEDRWDFGAIDDSNTIKPTASWFDVFRSYPFDVMHGMALNRHVNSSYMRVLNSAFQFDFPIGPFTYIENHDHSTVTNVVGGRDQWYKTQPYAIALATCSGGILIHNGQEFGQDDSMWEDDKFAPPDQKRVISRPLKWNQSADGTGQAIYSIYALLLKIRSDHEGLRSPNFYPNTYDESWRSLSPEGYGIDEGKQIIIFHRWGNTKSGILERFMIVLNFSDYTQYVNVPFPANGTWTDLLNNHSTVNIDSYWAYNYPIPSNWGCLFFK